MAVTRGWGFPGGSRKAHYFLEDGRSLCGRWGFFRGATEDHTHDSPSNCAECRRRRERLAAVPADGEGASTDG